MAIQNSEVARIFDEYADLLEINGANEYRIRAYRTAARNVSYLSRSLAEMVRRGEDLTEIPGIAEDLAAKVTEIIKTGHLSALENLKRTIPDELVSITRIAGLGPKRAFRLYYSLGITSIKELEQAAREGKIKELPGFGIKLEQAIIADIERKREVREGKRVLFSIAEKIIQPLLAYLSESPGINQLEAAGSYRRGVETVDDLIILASGDQASGIMDRFIQYHEVEKVLLKSHAHSTVLLRQGVQIDLRLVAEESFGAALHYYTGSRAHVTAIRKLGMRRRLRINEYGVIKGETIVAGKSEDEVYSRVNLPYIEPELRENRGEIEAARAGRLPRLITLEKIRGDLHTHTNMADGRSSLEEMAHAAQKRGYEYLAISDHFRHPNIARGLDIKRLRNQMEEIDKLNETLHGLVLIKGIEVIILENGSLDMPDEILKELDLVVCSLRYRFNLSRAKQTERIIRAMHNPHFMILEHPTGRIIDERSPYNIDMEKIILAAKETGRVLELNAQPDYLDLDDVYCKMARDLGVMVAISTDAHGVDELDFMQYGIIQGRRGWLEPENVLNTYSWNDIKRILKGSPRPPSKRNRLTIETKKITVTR